MELGKGLQEADAALDLDHGKGVIGSKRGLLGGFHCSRSCRCLSGAGSDSSSSRQKCDHGITGTLEALRNAIKHLPASFFASRLSNTLHVLLLR